MASQNRKRLSLPASRNHSSPCTPCVTPGCWQTRFQSTRPTPGFSTLAGSALVPPLVASAAHSNTPVPSSTPFTPVSLQRPSSRRTKPSISQCQRAARTFPMSCSTQRGRGLARPTSRARYGNWASSSWRISRSTRIKRRRKSSKPAHIRVAATTIRFAKGSMLTFHQTD